MKTDQIRRLAVTGLLAALCFLLGVTPLGMIPIPPVQATLLHIPVIIAALIVGPISGIVVSLVFITVSFFNMLIPPSSFGEWAVIAALLITPRILIAPVTALVRGFARKWKQRYFADGAAALLGSLTNTALFAVFTWIFKDTLAGMLGLEPLAFAIGFLTSIALNGAAECVCAAVIVPPVCAAVRKVARISQEA